MVSKERRWNVKQSNCKTETTHQSKLIFQPKTINNQLPESQDAPPTVSISQTMQGCHLLFTVGNPLSFLVFS